MKKLTPIVLQSNFLLLILVGLFLVGCSSSNYGIHGNKPPKAKLEIGDNSFETTLGSYCWQGNNQSECVDKAGPKEQLNGTEPIKVKPGEKLTFNMNYEPQPNEIHLSQIDGSKIVEVNVKDNSFTAPSEKGVYYYSYGVWWMDDKNKHVSHSSASYEFVISVE